MTYAGVLEESSTFIQKLKMSEKGSLAEAIKKYCKAEEINYRAAMKSLRAALSGLKVGRLNAKLQSKCNTTVFA